MKINRCVLWPVLGILALWLQTAAASAVIFTINTAIGVNNTNYDGQDIVVIGCTLTVDGAHSFADVLLLDGGKLTHSFAVNGVLANPLIVTNELQTLTGTNTSTLDNTNVEVGTIVVTDTNISTTYAAGTDYLISSNGASYQIARASGSTIPDGAAVFVSYTWLGTPVNAGLNLTVSNNLVVEAGSAIDVVGAGYGGGSGPGAGAAPSVPMVGGGGGGYGGFGGSSPGVAAGGNSYGLTTTPANLGSGGGTDFGPGASGGGAVKLVVGGAIWVDGQIVADGADGLSGGSGGGSGGSIWLTSATFGGAGTISANGGAGEPFDGGGGGGGRIAIYYGSTEFTGNFSAHGGIGVTAGGAGTIYTRLTGNPAGQVLVDNAGLQGTNTTVNGTEAFDLTVNGSAVVVPAVATVGNLLIGSNSWITIFPSLSGLSLIVNSNATIQTGGGITLDGKGNPAGQGLGSGVTRTTNNYQFGTGASYGGMGGLSGPPNGLIAPGGITYGSITQPADPGSGGGLAPGTPFNMGGSGGGLLRLSVAGTLTLNGLITANGNAGTGSTGGGGSGGGIALTVGTLTGAGNITANGGAGDLPYGGGGAGGRIAINFVTDTFTGGIFAHGGQGAQIGGAGTIYTKLASATFASLVVDNGGQRGASTPLPVNSQPIYDLTISGGAAALLQTAIGPGPFFRIHNLLIASNSSLTYMSTSTILPLVLQLTVSGDATIQPGGSILGDGLGYAAGQGPGKGGSSNILPGNSSSSGGGGHGGFGGAGASGAAGGAGYGSISGPTDAGSGGGGGSQPNLQSTPGGAGGGAMTITVFGTLTLNGRISANGTDAFGQGGGGGAGGSLWLMGGTLSGTGILSANGGAGDFPNGGGGGGGRIAILCPTNQFTGTISVFGGQGSVRGGAGTLYTKQNNSQFGTILVDGGGSSGANTSLTQQFPVSDLTVTGGAMLLWSNSVGSIHNLVIASNSSVIISGQVSGQGGSLPVTGNATVQSGGSINADGMGFAANSGTGAGAFLSSTSFGSTGSGGSYGGNGGAGASGASTLGAYGNLLEPQNFGSGGGTGGTTNSGAAGGGEIHMSVTGTLTLTGTISANGAIPNFPAGGGGSGGSVWLSVGTITGTGLISANGASGDLPYGGGGGGGRVAVIYGTNQFTGSVIAQGGPGFANGGAGTVYFQGRNLVGQVIVDNGGLVGTNTPLSGDEYNLTVSGGAVATPPPPGALRIASLTIDSGGIFTQLSAGQGNVSLTVQGDALIGPGGGIVVDGDGFSGNESALGVGSMTNLNSGGSGGGYGGAGGASASGTPGGSIYGSLQQPMSLGSRGGLLPIVPNLSAGGGAIQLNVNGKLTVNGKISANGENGLFNYGGGSGGSIFLTVSNLLGNGVISANGGAGQPLAGGGGGGGRIAIYYGTNAFTGMTTATGGKGAFNGQDGTIFVSFRIVFGISGIVTDTNGLPLSGISLQSSDGSVAASTDANGNYSLVMPQGWSGTVGPCLSGCLFTPTQYSYNNATGMAANQNFVMVPPPFALTGTGTGTGLNLGWFGADGVNYQVLSSSNLVDWLPYGSPVTGTNGMINLPIPTTDASQMFFRLSTGD